MINTKQKYREDGFYDNGLVREVLAGWDQDPDTTRFACDHCARAFEATDNGYYVVTSADEFNYDLCATCFEALVALGVIERESRIDEAFTYWEAIFVQKKGRHSASLEELVDFISETGN